MHSLKEIQLQKAASDTSDDDFFPSQAELEEDDKVQFNFVHTLDSDRTNEQMFCDFTIVTASRRFQVHKCLVGVASDFFKKSMTTQMQERYNNSVSVKSVSDDIMEQILDYIYGKPVRITPENCRELYIACDFLQLSQLTKSCLKYLSGVFVHTNDIFSFWLFAQQYGLSALVERYESNIKTNFVWLSDRKDILKISPKSIETYLALRDESTSEQHFCEFILKWIEFDKPTRLIHFSKLFKLVNLSKLDKSYISSKLMDNKLILKDSGCLKRLVLALKTHMLDTKPSPSLPESSAISKPSTSQSVQTQQQSLNEMVLVEIDSSKLVATKYNFAKKRWTDLPSLSGNFEFANVAIDDEVLFAVGGHENSSDSSASLVCNLDLSRKDLCWKVLTSIPRERQKFGCFASGGFIYVAGGQSGEDHATYLKSMECFSINEDEWSKTASMNYYRAGCCLVAYGKRLYALGGNSKSFFHPTVEIFDDGNWKMGARMQRWRSDFAAVVLNNHLYAIGGKGNEYIYCREVEVYSFKTEEWKPVASLNIPRAGHGACVVNGKIYVAGGTNSKGWKMPMEFYDPEEDVWTEMSFKSDPKRAALVALT